MTKNTLGDEALITFFQALALTIWGLDDMPAKRRSMENFIRVLDGYLNELVKSAEAEGSDMDPETVQIVRRLLDRGLDGVRASKVDRNVN